MIPIPEQPLSTRLRANRGETLAQSETIEQGRQFLGTLRGRPFVGGCHAELQGDFAQGTFAGIEGPFIENLQKSIQVTAHTSS
ncbi:hypothetical protein KIH39_08240 [Telmatocola sphagniphila]|uniref:Uncharacterized protein n=1 Tax=Telmatocola sphagniphila TaxID=1123043 RepID=A0A8E6EZV9_9BACT|nr:hypothetical protein KIH39_08240 [Telmatocola sphagniphila]